ncbi:hypothetical protein, partial [Enterobacter asburiae]|uniref:hypothetical protein n=1 Tax=Enterobacter asburiae TaxID=61645 RepID=UPI0021D1F98C
MHLACIFLLSFGQLSSKKLCFPSRASRFEDYSRDLQYASAGLFKIRSISLKSNQFFIMDLGVPVA